jgi:hypothetical protein
MRGYLNMPIFLCLIFVTNSFSQQELFFQQDAPWFQDVSSAAPDSQSEEVISWLQSKGGWGGGKFQIDFSIEVLIADQSAPFRAFTPTDDFYSPDCDQVAIPVPTTGRLEGESGYQCTNDGDCHLLVFYTPTRTLFEMWRANIVNSTFSGGCLAVWKLNTPWKADGRGNECTSADAAGLEIAPLLFTADEVKAGKINHAIRFILPNNRIRHSTYVHPGTHATSAASGTTSAPPYGARFRLRSDFPLTSLPNDGARVVAVALQKYGMFLADGGTIALTAQSDSYTTAKWSSLLEALDLNAIKASDFQMMEGGKRYAWTGDCTRTPLAVGQSKQSISSCQSIRLMVNRTGSLALSGKSSGEAMVRIVDITGKLCFEGAIDEKALVSPTLPSGAYFYQLTFPNETVHGKLVLAR